MGLTSRFDLVEDALGFVPSEARLVLLVHGTFSQESDWWRPHGEFRKRLEDKLRTQDKTFVVWPPRGWVKTATSEEVASLNFSWSGANSQNARIEASKELQDLISEITFHRKDLGIYLIGHSHGGNICVDAAKQQIAQASNIISDQSIQRVVTLGTPFLTYHQFSKGHFDAAIARTIWIFLPAAMTFFLFGMGILWSLALSFVLYIAATAYLEICFGVLRDLPVRDDDSFDSGGYFVGDNLQPTYVCAICSRHDEAVTLLESARSTMLNSRDLARSLAPTEINGQLFRSSYRMALARKGSPEARLNTWEKFLIVKPLMWFERSLGKSLQRLMTWVAVKIVAAGISRVSQWVLGADNLSLKISRVDTHPIGIRYVMKELSQEIESDLLQRSVTSSSDLVRDRYSSIFRTTKQFDGGVSFERVLRDVDLIHNSYLKHLGISDLVVDAISNDVQKKDLSYSSGYLGEFY